MGNRDSLLAFLVAVSVRAATLTLFEGGRQIQDHPLKIDPSPFCTCSASALANSS
jgi:hypothetical protein